MARYSSGQPVRLSTTVRDLTGTLVNATTLTLTVQKPDASSQTYSSPVNDSTGTYHQDIPVTDLAASTGGLGHYQYKWTATGTGAGESFGDFDVFDPFETSVLPLADAKDMLNIPQTTTTYDTELQVHIATVETSLEGFTGGPLVNRPVTERAELTGSYTVLQVRQRPLVSVTSIVSVASGIALDISAGLDIDPNAGTIRRKLGYPFYGPFFMWLPAMSVTYVAGWGTAVPAAFNLAARIIVKHLWDTQRGVTPAPMMGGDEVVSLPGWGYAIPERAAELLDGTLNGMSFRLEAYV
jgi:hypothetical protein